MTPRAPTLIVVPVKDPTQAKTRLSGVLTGRVRQRLAKAMLRRSLSFLKPVPGKHDLAVVTSSQTAARIAKQNYAMVLPETGQSLNGAVGQAAHWATAKGYERLCVIPADLVAPTQRDLDRLLESPADITVCPSHDGGTNALLVTPPRAIAFQYGPNSAERHLVAGQAAGLTTAQYPLESFRFDLDTSEHVGFAMACWPELAQVLRA
jgi:2-phospho-L-lactate guanylyltransferase